MKLDAHTHPAKFSDQGLADLSTIYKNLGITAVVSTNHARLEKMDQQAFKAFTDDYIRFSGIMAGAGIKTFFGAEAFVQGTEYLVYGMYPHEFMGLLGLHRHADFIQALHSAGALAVQSHPFRIKRGRMVHMLGKVCDGYEINNCHPRHSNNNDLALLLLARLGGVGTGGSDAHKPSHAGGCMELPSMPADEKELAGMLLQLKH